MNILVVTGGALWSVFPPLLTSTLHSDIETPRLQRATYQVKPIKCRPGPRDGEESQSSPPVLPLLPQLSGCLSLPGVCGECALMFSVEVGRKMSRYRARTPCGWEPARPSSSCCAVAWWRGETPACPRMIFTARKFYTEEFRNYRSVHVHTCLGATRIEMTYRNAFLETDGITTDRVP